MSTPTDHEALRTALGPYVLGDLPADEVPALEAHLDGCAACTAELAALTPVAAALGGLRGTRPALPQPPPDLADRVGAAVAADARRGAPGSGLARRAGTLLVAAAVGAALTLGVTRLVTDPAAPVVPVEAVPVAVGAPGLVASAGLVPHTWGVEVKLTASGFTAGDRYRVVVLGPDGAAFPAGEFVGTGERTMRCNLNSSVLRERASGFEVLGDDGRVLVRSAFPRA
ncbi:zf-HC2 domain-containing protein [Arthrobacter sp. NEB 688]|uniref:anti-sigma factor family protein n=1 Tax=Arthrobacter sp. NEB 688 TaxID=904039 RepID=UPI001562FD02|nr:zf-HC2 domain-containing protein [Arthrobacter sp. NEB 688]QKE84135.1 zf-HC2 domain-containing protein [Arthrobacter sp. NEB 688]